MVNDWLYELNDNINLFFENLSKGSQPYSFLPSIGGVTSSGSKLSLGFSCYALKTYFMTGLWDNLKQNEKNEWANFINSFQNDNLSFPPNSFLDTGYIEGFKNEQYKKILKNTAKIVSTKIGYRKFESINNQLRTFVRAETKQAISSLIQVGSFNKFPYLDFPSDNISINEFLYNLDWNRPWSAGAQYSGICLFTKSQIDKNHHLIENLSNFSNQIVKKDTGGYYINNTPNKNELINGAMKMISGFDWIEQKIHFPEKLIDLCLDTSPSSEGCDLVDIVYVLYMCTKQTNYKKREIINYYKEIISLIKLHYYKEFYGFSYYKNKSQTHYYGVKITKGKDTPDLHGTTLLIWALSMIIEVNEINLSWNTLKP